MAEEKAKKTTKKKGADAQARLRIKVSASREQFEMRIHTRLIDILNPQAKVIEALTNLSLPSGVNIDVKMA